MVLDRLERTEKLARHTRLMMQLRDIRDYAKVERNQATEEDAYVWEDLYTVVLESLVMTEQAIAGLLPSGMYHYKRDPPKP